MAMRRRIKVGVNLSAAKRKPKLEPDNISIPLSQIKAEVPQNESTAKQEETPQTKLKTEPPTIETQSDAAAFKCPPRVDFNRSNSNTTTANNDEINQLEIDGAQVMQMDLQRTANSISMSPSKSQRQRIRPTPIFGQRRNSLVGLPPSPLSLSSEDANELAASPQKRERHYSGSQNCVPTSSSSTGAKASCYGTGRIRTESTCSVFSDSHTTTTTKSRKHDDHNTQRTQSRRDFESRFLNGVPDKSNLKMFDLIYYNPATNPMEQKPKIDEMIKKERKDDVPDDEAEFLDNDASAVPVPQLKLNAKGELILDDKSLEIETTAEQEARKVLAKSSLIYLDENTGMNGFYKRHKRTRDWAPEDTIRFYRCLQTIGTDFSMMCQLFPKRTRRDIKLKFKKEERCNGALINKALLHPNLFNIQELKDQFESEDREREEEELKRQANQQIQYKKVKIKTSKSARALKNADDIYNQELREMEVKKPKKQRKVKSSNKNEIVEIETKKKPKKKRQTKKSEEKNHTSKTISLDEDAAINLLLKDEEEFLTEVKNSAPLRNSLQIDNDESCYTPENETMPAENDCIEFIANDAIEYDASQHFDYMSDSDASQNDNEFRVGTPDANSRTLVNMDSGNFTLVKDIQTLDEQQYVRFINNEEMDSRFRALSSNMSADVDEQNSLFGLVECDTYLTGKCTPKIENTVSSEEPKSSMKILPETQFSPKIENISSYTLGDHPYTFSPENRRAQNENCSGQAPIRSPDDDDDDYSQTNDEAEIQKILENIANGSLVVVSTFNPDSPDEHSNEIYMLDPTTGELCDEPLDLPSELIQSILSVMT